MANMRVGCAKPIRANTCPGLEPGPSYSNLERSRLEPGSIGYAKTNPPKETRANVQNPDHLRMRPLRPHVAALYQGGAGRGHRSQLPRHRQPARDFRPDVGRAGVRCRGNVELRIRRPLRRRRLSVRGAAGVSLARVPPRLYRGRSPRDPLAEGSRRPAHRGSALHHDGRDLHARAVGARLRGRSYAGAVDRGRHERGQAARPSDPARARQADLHHAQYQRQVA